MRYYSGIIKVVALAILIPMLLWKSTFSKTFQLYKDYQHIQILEDQLAHSTTPKALSITNSLHNENLISNGRVIDLISRVCEENSVSIKQFEPKLLDSENNYKLYIGNLTLSGNYIDLVKTLKFWEDTIPIVRISSLKFEYDEKIMKDKKVEMSLSFRQIEK